jgi:hypothetical protein
MDVKKECPVYVPAAHFSKMGFVPTKNSFRYMIK